MSCGAGWTGEEAAQFVDQVHSLCSPEGSTESPGVGLGGAVTSRSTLMQQHEVTHAKATGRRCNKLRIQRKRFGGK